MLRGVVSLVEGALMTALVLLVVSAPHLIVQRLIADEMKGGQGPDGTLATTLRYTLPSNSFSPAAIG